MPDRRPAAPLARTRQPQRNNDQHRSIANLRNGRFHLALLVALAAALLIAAVIPITRTRASAQESTASAPTARDGVALAPGAPAATVAGALAEASLSSFEQYSPYKEVVGSVPGADLIPESLLATAGRVAARGALASPLGQTSLFLQRRRAVPFTVHESGFAFSRTSSRPTVGQALAGLGIRLGPGDVVSPGGGAALTPGLHIYIRYASPVLLSVGGQQHTAYTNAATVGDLLTEAGIALEPLDRLSPPAQTPVRRGMRVEVTTIRDVTEYVADPIPFSTFYWDDPDLPRGREALIQAGSDGYVRREYRVRYENGLEISRELSGETEVPAVDEIIALGSSVPPTLVVASLPMPEGTPDCWTTISVYATWYTAASAGGSGNTATGTGVYKGIVAVDPWVIPLGTRMYIPGYGYGVAADTGSGVVGNMIDLGYGPDDVFDWSTRWVDICILG